MPEPFISLKDIIIIAVGFVLGGYASFVASRVVLFYQLKHDVFTKVELLSALINADSFDFRCGYRIDRLLETKAIEFHFYGHESAYQLCHKLANELQTALDRVGSLRNPNYYDITAKKTAWLREVASCAPSWWAFFRPRRSVESVLDSYLSKEAEYVCQAKSDIARAGGSTQELK